MELLSRRCERHPGMVDGALTAVLLVAGLTLGLVELGYVGQRPEDALPAAGPSIVLAVAVTTAVVTPLAWRRRARSRC